MNMNEIINDFFKSNEYLTTKDAEQIGIPRYLLSEYVKEGKLERISRGIYALPNQFNDEYELLQKRNKFIFSYGTALYFHGLSDRVPNIINVSVLQGYNVAHIKQDSIQFKFHYVKQELFDFGIVQVKSPQG
jgi:predicted transcriptional regulator of viral defense system